MSHAGRRLDVGDVFPPLRASSVGHGQLELCADLFDPELFDGDLFGGAAPRRAVVLVYRAHW